MSASSISGILGSVDLRPPDFACIFSELRIFDCLYGFKFVTEL